LSLAVVKKRKSILVLAWLMPIIAVLISSNMLYGHYKKFGQRVTIFFDDVNGLDVRKSHLQYKGIFIGDIKSIKINDLNLSQYIVDIEIYKDYEYLITKGSKFFLVKPEISMTQIRSIGNVLTGNYIELIPENNDKYKLIQLEKKYNFNGYSSKPKDNNLFLTLESKETNFDKDTKVVYKGVQIGKILSKDIDKFDVSYKIEIYKKYQYLINHDTKFIKVNPIDVKADFNNFNLNVSPIKDFLTGVIEIKTTQEKSKPKEKYTLIDNQDKSKIDYFSVNIISNNLQKDEYIFYKGVKIGFVKDIKLKQDKNIAKLNIEKKYKYLINDSTKFYKLHSINSKISLEDGIKIDIPTIKETIFGGISFITDKQTGLSKQKVFSLYNNINDLNHKKEFEILVTLKDNHNIKKGSKLFYKNIDIGKVDSLILDSKIQAKILVNEKYRYLFGVKAKIYSKGVKISLDKIENLNTTIFGDNLYLIDDQYGNFTNNFKLDCINPIDTKYEKGLRIEIFSKNVKDLHIKSPIYFKGVQIGQIENIRLHDNFDKAILTLFIKYKYRKLIQSISIFKRVKNVNIDLSLFDAKIELGTLKSIMNGGLELTNYNSKIKHSIKVNQEFIE
jgi:paraquat-inducible protein B